MLKAYLKKEFKFRSFHQNQTFNAEVVYVTDRNNFFVHPQQQTDKFQEELDAFYQKVL